MDHNLCKDCKGFCCDDIGVNSAPHELQNSYHRSIKRGDRDKDRLITMSIPKSGVSLWIDIHLIYPMLVFTHQDKVHPDGDIQAEHAIYHYKCKHHNRKTGDCDIYEERPMMCRSFPDNGFCGYRKVRDKRVKACRPKWFKIGLSYHDWYYGMYPDKKEIIPILNQSGKKIAEETCPIEVKAEETKQ